MRKGEQNRNKGLKQKEFVSVCLLGGRSLEATLAVVQCATFRGWTVYVFKVLAYFNVKMCVQCQEYYIFVTDAPS